LQSNIFLCSANCHVCPGYCVSFLPNILLPDSTVAADMSALLSTNVDEHELRFFWVIVFIFYCFVLLAFFLTLRHEITTHPLPRVLNGLR
jgi:hypothetical protein